MIDLEEIDTVTFSFLVLAFSLTIFFICCTFDVWYKFPYLN